MIGNVITQFTDYDIFLPDFFITELSNEFEKRDLYDLTGGKLSSIRISGILPLVEITSSIFSGGKPDFGLLPAISVIDSSESEDDKTIGDGVKGYRELNSDFIEELKNKCLSSGKAIFKDGIVSESQIMLLENGINNGKKFICEIHSYTLLSNLLVGLWSHNFNLLNVLSAILRSSLYNVKNSAKNHGAMEFQIKTDKGLINANFGRTLFGQESEVTFKYNFKNYIVYEE